MSGPHPRPKRVPYTKPALTLKAQLEQLKNRGLQVGDDARAIHFLGELNYYRLGAYWLPYENDHANHRFHPDTTFEKVLNLYDLDRGLRLLILDAVERIEVSIRTKLAYVLGHKYGPHAHLKPQIFFDPIEYGRSITKLDQEVKRSGEEFIKHLTQKYEELLPPIWAVVELLTIGQLSKWYNNLESRHDRKAIADTYDIDENNLRSFLHHLCTVRNLCAHHSRVWNREYTFTFSMKGGDTWDKAARLITKNAVNLVRPVEFAADEIGHPVTKMGQRLRLAQLPRSSRVTAPRSKSQCTEPSGHTTRCSIS